MKVFKLKIYDLRLNYTKMVDGQKNDNLRDVVKRIINDLKPKNPALVEKVIMACEPGLNVEFQCYNKQNGSYKAAGTILRKMVASGDGVPDGLTLETVNYGGDYIPYNDIVAFRVLI